MASPRETQDLSTRKNFDKRTIRKMYAVPFESAITTRRLTDEGGAVLQYSAQDVQVYCRKRPLNEKERGGREFDVLSVGTGGSATLHDAKMHPDLQHAFLNNHRFPVPCFDEDTTTEHLCQSVRLDELYKLAAEGGHGTCCMFGQTGSGKTFTMAGILQHTAAALFGENRNPEVLCETEVRVACFEVCGKQCYDLLKSGEKLVVREDASGAVQVSAATVEVRSGQALLEVLSFAASQRISCSTLKNTDSSRSHAFYRLIMKPTGGGKGKAKQKPGSLTFVDLAGSERAADTMYHSVEQIKQTAEINASLAALKECVRVRSQQLRSAGKKRVPYRSSRLTMLLRDSFETEGGSAGKARTVVIVTVAPGCADTEHTLNTLRNACMMAGLEATAAKETKTEVSLTDNEMHRQAFMALVKHPCKWDTKEVADWFASACDGLFKRTGTALPPGLDGKALMRFSEARWRLTCGGEAKVAARMMAAFKAETARANTSKNAAAANLRNAKAALQP